MRLKLSNTYQEDTVAQGIAQDLQACVQCGMCTATCPSFQMTGNELDGPRGRLVLVKDFLSGHPVSADSLHYINRCMSCRSCETTCPSKVPVVSILERGKGYLEKMPLRSSWRVRFQRTWGRSFVRSRWFGSLLQLGLWVRFILPQSLQKKLPMAPKSSSFPTPSQGSTSLGKIWWLQGCVQKHMMPSIDQAAIALYQALGWTVEKVSIDCCGAIDWHAGQTDLAQTRMQSNMDEWRDRLASDPNGVLVMSSSACVATIRRYAQYLGSVDSHDWLARVKTMDELLLSSIDRLKKNLNIPHNTRISYHAPCTEQHWMQKKDQIESLLQALGYTCLPVLEKGICCGSAGMYQLEQPELSMGLKARKVKHLEQHQPTHILSSNMGCMLQIQSGTTVPVLHWIELLAQHWQENSD